MEQDPNAQELELTPSQLALKALADEMLALRPEGYGLNVIRFTPAMAPSEVESRLYSSSLSDLLLKEGDSLSANPSSDYWPDLNLHIGEAQVIQAEVRAWGWDYDTDDNPIRTPNKDQQVGSWGRQLDIMIWYSNGKNEASQNVTVQTWSTHANDTPMIYRNVIAPAYAEMGYEGHNSTGREAESDQEVLDFVNMVRGLFESQLSSGDSSNTKE